MSVRYYCPIAACTWHHDAASVPRPPLAQLYITSAIDTRSRTVKETLDAHFDTHPRDEWIAEIIHVRACRESADDQTRRAEVKLRSVERFIRTLRKSTTDGADGALRRQLAKQLSSALRAAT